MVKESFPPLVLFLIPISHASYLYLILFHLIKSSFDLSLPLITCTILLGAELKRTVVFESCVHLQLIWESSVRNPRLLKIFL